MIKQQEFEVTVKPNPTKLFFTGRDRITHSLQDLNSAGWRLIQIVEVRDNIQEILRKVAIFNFELIGQ